MVGQHYLEAYYGRGFDGREGAGNGRAKGMSRKQQAILAAGTTHADPYLDITP